LNLAPSNLEPILGVTRRFNSWSCARSRSPSCPRCFHCPD
jgi:hypothetical protein